MYVKPGGGLKDRTNKLRVAREQAERQRLIEAERLKARNVAAMFTVRLASK